MPVRAPARGTDPTTILTTVRLSSRLQAEIPAGWTGLEPAASGVTGRRYNQLNYHPSGTEPSPARSFFVLLLFPLSRSASHPLLLSTSSPVAPATPCSLLLVGGTGFEPATAGL